MACSFFSKQRKFFSLALPPNIWTQRLSAPLMSMEEGKNEKERGVAATEALSLYPSVVFGVMPDAEVCHVDRILVRG